MQPWVDHYRQHALAVLARALAAVRHGALAPCLFIHGAAGSGKSLLATAMVRECEAVWCLDCVANAYRWRSTLRLGAIELAQCAVFVIDAIDLLGGAELQRFYGRCSANGTVLVLMSESRDAPQAIGFPLPATSTVFRLSREDGLTPDRSPTNRY
jgi:chromosomal replication initiation ATPase DnaA